MRRLILLVAGLVMIGGCASPAERICAKIYDDCGQVYRGLLDSGDKEQTHFTKDQCVTRLEEILGNLGKDDCDRGDCADASDEMADCVESIGCLPSAVEAYEISTISGCWPWTNQPPWQTPWGAAP